jgi:hydrogenase maturation protein HypF
VYVHGRVQGVGFRPFVYRLAHDFKLKGWVQNCSGEVVIHIQGEPAVLDAFQQALIQEAPPLAQPYLGDIQTAPLESCTGFAIQISASHGEPDIHVPPDAFTCEDCLAELQDPLARRYRYPFINCTQCGPRYTLIRALPYDRPNTTLADFPLCPACGSEYQNPLDRRFHAQPLACSQCGPQVTFSIDDSDTSQGEQALADCLTALKAGQIVAVKGVGGYHLLCDATRESAVQRLRERKRRPNKPLAVMFPQQGVDGLARVRTYTHLTAAAEQQLKDPMRPIVLVQKGNSADLAPSLAPGLDELGVFLPYSPLHHLILGDFKKPLVATSGNISGEPVITDNRQATIRLEKVADAFLHHNRPIQRPADDPVYRVIAGAARPLRLGRGNAPLELSLATPLREPLLALGGHMKTTVALAWSNRVVVSPHIGELDSPRSLEVLEQVCHELQQLYGVTAHRLVCDAHPGFISGRWADTQGLSVTKIFHHHAHAAALAGEFASVKQWLMFTWDGVGFGPDSTLWGGETLGGRPGQWQQLASLRWFRLPGGDRAGREPWRSAAALCWETGVNAPTLAGWELAYHAWQRNLNSPVTSAAGRLFDAAAALIAGIQYTSFEGQGPMLLETLAGDCDDSVDLPLLTDGKQPIRVDWSPLLGVIRDTELPAPQRAAIFHNSMADCVVQQTLHFREIRTFDGVGLTGGVFQNRKLAERVKDKLETAGVQVYLSEKLPCNDGGLSYGQAVEAAALLA